jgi:hypothetical protein
MLPQAVFAADWVMTPSPILPCITRVVYLEMGPWEVIRFRWSHEGGALVMGYCPRKRFQRACVLPPTPPPCHVLTHEKVAICRELFPEMDCAGTCHVVLGLMKCEKIHFYCLRHPDHATLHWQPQQYVKTLLWLLSVPTPPFPSPLGSLPFCKHLRPCRSCMLSFIEIHPQAWLLSWALSATLFT